MITKEELEHLKQSLGSARLMAVSKLHPREDVLAMYNAGQRLFGENHVQEIVEKFALEDGKTLNKPADLELHMIGHLQTNKVNKVVPLVDMIESVDSIHLLEKINGACEKIGKVMPVLLELNTSGESSKSGFATEEELCECLRRAESLRNVKVRGLMTVGPVDCPPERKDSLTRRSFIELRSLFTELRKNYKDLDILSMGMSGDYKIAVEEGSTEVRIGTLLFGKRDYGSGCPNTDTADGSSSANMCDLAEEKRDV